MRLKELRKQKQLSQTEFAKLFNVAQNTVSNWENGIRTIDTTTLNRLADFFNVSSDYILGRTDSPSSPAPAEVKESTEKDIQIYMGVRDLPDKDKDEILYLIQYKKRQNTPASPFQSSRTFTTADLEDGIDRIAAFGGMEENDDEPLTT